MDSNITEEEFDKQFNLYLDKKIKEYNESNIEVAKEENSGLNKKIYMIVLSVIFAAIIISILVSRIVKVRKKNKL